MTAPGPGHTGPVMLQRGQSMETWLGQILVDGKWLDYARGTEKASRSWQALDPTNRRVVDWINKGKILIAARDAS